MLGKMVQCGFSHIVIKLLLLVIKMSSITPSISFHISQCKTFSFQWQIKDDTEKLKKKEEDVTRELKSTKLTLEKKEVDRLQIQKELDAVSFQYLYCRLNA